MNMNIKTKLTYGIGLLFVLITLLGGLAIKNIHNVSDDTQNILADNYKFTPLFPSDARVTGCHSGKSECPKRV